MVFLIFFFFGLFFFFFFQAEDGIRDDLVTGVQTCALPISRAFSVINASGMLITICQCHIRYHSLTTL